MESRQCSACECSAPPQLGLWDVFLVYERLFVVVREGAAIWEAATAVGGDKWSRDLAVAAMAVVDLHSPGATNSAPQATPESVPALEVSCGSDAALFLIEYTDGFKSSLLHCQGGGNVVAGWSFAAKIKGQDELVSCCCECPRLAVQCSGSDSSHSLSRTCTGLFMSDDIA